MSALWESDPKPTTISSSTCPLCLSGLSSHPLFCSVHPEAAGRPTAPHPHDPFPLLCTGLEGAPSFQHHSCRVRASLQVGPFPRSGPLKCCSLCHFLSGRLLFLFYLSQSLRDFLWASHPTSIALTEEYNSVLTCVLGPHPSHPPDRLHGLTLTSAGSALGTKQELLIFGGKNPGMEPSWTWLSPPNMDNMGGTHSTAYKAQLSGSSQLHLYPLCEPAPHPRSRPVHTS